MFRKLVGVWLIIPVFSLSGCNFGFTPSINSDVENASRLIKQKQYDKAVAILEKVLQSDARNSKANYYSAVVDERKHKYQAALEKLNIAIEVDPGFPAAYSERSFVESLLNDQAAALVDANHSVALEPAVPLHRVRRALINLNSKEFNKVLSDLKEVEKLDPKYERYWVSAYRAEAYLGLKDYKLARENYDEAIRLAPKGQNSAVIRRAILRVRTNDLVGAKQDCENYLKSNPKDSLAHTLHAALVSAEGQTDKGAEEYNKALPGPGPLAMADYADLGADNYRSVTTFVDVILQKKDPKKAAAVLTRVESHRPLEPQEQYRLAIANFALKQPERAIGLLNSCIAMQPDYIEPRVALIRHYASQGLAQKALELQREAFSVARTPQDKAQVAGALIPRR